MEQIWKDVKGYQGKYKVSNLGRVKSLNYNHTGKEKIMKQRLNNKGYCYLFLKGKKHKLVHRLIAQAFITNSQNKPFIDHINGNPKDNRIQNLRWCNQKENLNNPISKIRQKEAQKITQDNKSPLFKAINLKNGQISYWRNQTKCARQIGVQVANLNQILLNKGRLKSIHGWTFQYALDVNTICKEEYIQGQLF